MVGFWEGSCVVIVGNVVGGCCNVGMKVGWLEGRSKSELEDFTEGKEGYDEGRVDGNMDGFLRGELLGCGVRKEVGRELGLVDGKSTGKTVG